jgi:hypothetical protein
MTFDMLGLLRQGHVTPTLNTTFDIGSINDIFDGDITTLARTPAVNPLVMTLAFDSAFSFKQTRMVLATDGTLKLEVASTLSDLNNKTGSYALAVNNLVLAPNTWGAATFSASGKYLRATVTRTSGDNYVHVNEWAIDANVTVNDILVFPSSSTTSNSAKLLTGKALQLSAKYADANKYTYAITDALSWSSNNTAVATVNSAGLVQATSSAGSATLSVAAGGVSQSVALSTVSSFTQTRDAARTRKVVVVLRDPPVPQHGNQLMHQLYGWNDPNAQVATVVARLQSASNNALNYKVVETDNIGASYLYTQWYGAELDFNNLVSWYDQGASFWQPQLNNAANTGNMAFEYAKLLTDLHLCEKRNAGLIDEVWVYTDPYGGMYESRLAGPDAFPYNSPPLLGTLCNRQLPIMGLNYEASTPNAVHSFGHRIENALTHATGRWSTTAPNPNAWELFSTLNKDKPGLGNVGDTHFPVNGTADYDYANPTTVTSYAGNWPYYPFLQNITGPVSCSTWGCTDDGYYQFMFGHLPRFTGVSDGLLNNWWYYVIDYPAAAKAARDLGSGNVGNSTLGFESTSGWTTSAGTEARDTTSGERTQGAASLKLTSFGAGATLTSAALSNTSVSVANYLSVDVRVPKELTGHTGARVQVCLKSPQRGISSYVCSASASLDGVAFSATSSWYTLPWTLPSATLSALKAGAFTDLQLQVILSGVPTAAQSVGWLFDNAQFFGP